MVNRKMILFGIILMSTFLLVAATKLESNKNEVHEVEDTKSNTIQLALLLDTSQSMNGLIEQAKSQMWNILNAMATIEKEDEETILEIALYEYGNPDRCKNSVYTNKLTDFTTDVDLISEKLFSLTTRGGEEYCGSVIKNSLDSLEWTNGDQLRMIYIAGNESFDQGPDKYKSIGKNAKEKEVFVNTIFCGDNTTGSNLEWEKGAVSGGGKYVSIEQNEETKYFTTPFDQEIANLNNRFNQTYIPYGSKGNEKKLNQTKQDENAIRYGVSNYKNRTIYKSSKKYKADDWDLVDAYKKDKNIITKKDLLNEEQANMSIEELERQIEIVSEDRESLRQEIQELNKKQKQHIEEQKRNQNTEHVKSLENKIIEVIQEQARSKGYQLK